MGIVHTGKVDAVAGGMTAGDTGTIDGYNDVMGLTGGAVVSTATAIGSGSALASYITALKGKVNGTGLVASGGGAPDTGLKGALAAAQAARDTVIRNTGAPAASGPGSDAAVEAAADALEAAEDLLAAISGSAAVDAKTVFDNRLQINVDASAETSSGLTFGVRSRIRINENETGALSAPRVYVKSGAVEVAVGNIYGALDSMPGMYDSEVGLTALSDAGVVLNTVGKGDWAFDNYSSQGKGVNGIEAIYSAGGFTGHLSYSEPDLSGSAAVTNKHVAAVGAYTMGDWTVALGMQDSDNNAEDKTVLTVGGKVGDYGVGFAAADNDGVQKIALNGSATFGATTVNGFVADDESGTDTALGLGVSYDLGGAAVMAGVERDAVGQTRADMGVSFSF